MTDTPFDEQTILWLQRRVEAYEKSLRASHKTYKALLRHAAITQLMLDDVQKTYVDAVTVDAVTVAEHVHLALAKRDDPYRMYALVIAPVDGTGTSIAVGSAVRAVRQAKKTGAETAAKKRHQPSAETKARAIELFRGRQWPSTSAAAKEVFKILSPISQREYGFKFAERGLKTVYEWLLKDKKSNTPAR